MKNYAVYFSITLTLFPDCCFSRLNERNVLKNLLSIEKKLQLMTLRVKSDTVL
jgi:hypothetical protein